MACKPAVNSFALVVVGMHGVDIGVVVGIGIFAEPFGSRWEWVNFTLFMILLIVEVVDTPVPVLTDDDDDDEEFDAIAAGGGRTIQEWSEFWIFLIFFRWFSDFLRGGVRLMESDTTIWLSSSWAVTRTFLFLDLI